MRNGKLPARCDARREEDRLIESCVAVLHSAVTRLPRHAVSGFHISDGWVLAHLDDDPVLVAKVMSKAGWTPADGRWRWRAGLWKLSEVCDLDLLGDVLVTLVDHHRPI